jgi:hypothetical protein
MKSCLAPCATKVPLWTRSILQHRDPEPRHVTLWPLSAQSRRCPKRHPSKPASSCNGKIPRQLHAAWHALGRLNQSAIARLYEAVEI